MSGFDQERFQEALARPRLQQPLPEYLPGNRAGGKVRVIPEEELQAMTRQWFVDFDRYHFNADDLIYEGESIWDFIDAAQSSGNRPSAEGWPFRALMDASRFAGLARQIKQQLPFFNGTPEKKAS